MTTKAKKTRFKNPPILYLVGFMGAGKTELGRRLAELLEWTFIDLDQEIEERDGTTIREIFERRGEAHFRALERQELQRVSERRHAVVAVGGGAFCSAENQEIMARTGISVWLDAPVEVLFARCRGEASRPLFTTVEEMALLHKRRRPYYAKAELHVQVAGQGVDDLAIQIRAALVDYLGPAGQTKSLKI